MQRAALSLQSSLFQTTLLQKEDIILIPNEINYLKKHLGLLIGRRGVLIKETEKKKT